MNNFGGTGGRVVRTTPIQDFIYKFVEIIFSLSFVILISVLLYGFLKMFWVMVG